MQITTAIGLGDIIYLKSSLDHIKNQHKEIKIMFAHGLIKWANRNADYSDFVNDLGKLLFDEPPYIITDQGPEFKSWMETYSDNNIQVIKPNLPQLCQGKSLWEIEPSLNQEYIVITTKVRYFPKRDLSQLWDVLKNHQVVILGEREVQMNNEYQNDNRNGPTVYSIYPELIKLPNIIDQTIPALGITSPTISQYRQDCLIMSQAKCMITLGIGGNFTTGLAVAKNLIGYRPGNEPYADRIFEHSEEIGNSFVTKDWNKFIKKLGEL